jgi:HK97 family phage portal protein
VNILQKAAARVFRLDIRSPDGWLAAGDLAESGEEVNDRIALGISAVWACVNLLAGTIGSLPLMVYRDVKGVRTVDREHPLYRVLHSSPNFDQTAVDFWEFVQASLELAGDAFAEKVFQGTTVSSLVPILAANTTTRRRKDGSIAYRWTRDGKVFEGTEKDVLHIRGFGGSPLGGMSTLQFARNSVGLARAVERSASATFRNGLRPSGALQFKDFLSAEHREIANNQLVNKLMGAQNAGLPMILEGGAEWKQFTITPEDAQMLESRRFSVEEICRFFGVPPHMIGHTEKSSSWGTGLEQQTLGFQKFTLTRRLRRIEQALQKQLLTPQDIARGVTIEFSLEGLLRGDSAGRASFYSAMAAMGAMTINEIRDLENLPPVEGGNVPRMQMQNVPITEAGNAGRP